MNDRLAIVAAAAFALPFTASAAGPIELDGAFGDWPAGTQALADERFIYLRLDTPEMVTLQQAPWTVSVLLDDDASASTGERVAWDDSGLGVDLRLEMSPPFEGRIGNGVSAMRHNANAHSRISNGSSAFAWAPTHAADAFEIRIDRAFLNLRGDVAIRVAGLDADGDAVWTRDAIWLELPELAAGPKRIDLELPARPKGAVRVLSWNVLWGSPMRDPEPFDRVKQALQADVILLQEWDERSRDAPAVTVDEIERWFNFNEPEPVWKAIKGGERGVVIVTRLPMERIETRTLTPVAAGDPNVRTDRGIRFAAARVRTPVGDLVAGSLHLKCCGGYLGAEDSQRMAEARAIRQTVQSAIASDQPDMVIIAGDYNLVGSPEPLAIIASGTDVDGTDLVVAETRNLGRRVRLTWHEEGSRFAPGRLDFALVGDATASIANAFVFDASALSDATLQALGVERGDTTVSDHLPLVIDILPEPN